MTSILESLVLDGFDLNSVAGASSSGYSGPALALSPSLYWRHGEPSGTTANDTSGNARTGTYGSGITVNQTGLLTGDTDKAITLDGTANAKVTSTYNPFTGNMTVCGWANATTLAAARNVFGGSAATGPLVQIQTDGSVIWWSDLTAATQTWAAGTWTAATTLFWVLTWNNSTKQSELFLNAVSKGTKTSANAFNATPGNFILAGSGAANGFLGTMDETLVFAGTILSQAQITALYTAGSVASMASAFTLQGYDVPPPAKRQEWAQGADTDGALLVRDPLFDNREITLRLRVRQQTTMDLALSQLGLLSKKLEEAEQQPDGLALVWTPSGASSSVTFYVLSGTVEGLPISLTGDDAGWFLRSPVVTVKLICKPFGYGTPVTSSTASSATPYVTATIASVGGDVPAEGRLLASGAAQNMRYVEWGLEQRYYDAATSLLVDSDDMVTSGYAGFQTTRGGAYDPNASGNSLIRGTLIGVPTAICSTAGTLTHVGTYRVKARVYASGTATEYLRLAWQEGDGPFRANPYVQPSVTGNYSEVDLRLITIPPKQLGTQRWQGRIEAYTSSTPGTDTLDVDYLVLVPAGEGYGKARGASVAGVPTVPSARDEFNQTAGALSGKTLPIGGVWARSGDTDDFNVSGAGLLTRTAVSDAGFFTPGPCFEVAGSTTFTNVVAQADIKWNATVSGHAGVLIRFVDTSNYAYAYITYGTVQVLFVVGGTFAAGGVTIDSQAFASLDTFYTLRLQADASGRWGVWVYPQGGTPSNDPDYSGWSTDLATGGALASGKVGLIDWHSSASAKTRTYDNFMAWAPTIPTVLYSGRVAEIRHDGAIRQDSTGVYYGPVPAYRGSRFLVPAAGDESRTSRLLVKAHRNDIEAEPSDTVTDNVTIQTVIVPRYVVVPF